MGSSNGTENLIRFDSDSNRFLGAEYWTAFNTDTFSNKTDLSNVPAASILLDYKKAVKTLTFTIGNSGQLNPWAVVGKNSRFFSIAMGDAVTAGDGFEPTGQIDDAVVSIEILDEFELEASGSCETEDGSQVVRAGFTLTFKDEDGNGSALSETTTYTFKVSSSGVPADGSFDFDDASVVAYGADDEEDVNGVRIVSGPDADGNGEIVVEAGVVRVEVRNEYQANYELTGNETITLSLSNGVQSEAETTLSLNTDECPPPLPPCGDEIDVDAIGVCDEGDEDGKRASFTFEVTIEDPCEEAKVYEYDFCNVKGLKGYELLGIEVVNADDVTVLTPGEKSGEFEFAAGVESFAVTVEIEAQDALRGDEELMLEVTNPETGSSDNEVAKIANFENCEPAPPPPPPVDPPDVQIEAEGACVDSETLSDKDAVFSFSVALDPASESAQIYDYSLEASNLSGDGYVVNSVTLDPKKDVLLLEGGESGQIQVAPGVSEFEFSVRVTANSELTGSESLSLELAQDGDVLAEATASLEGLEDCLPEPPPENGECIDDVVLYLVLDNSTSMLQPDPSTTAASRSDRLEAQDRVALYAYQQAIGKVGYGFSRIGSDDVLSTTEFRDAVINNSSTSLAETLTDFEVVLLPDVSADEAQKVTVHLITYGYAVDYDKTTFGPNNPQKGMDVAQTILDVKTPDQIYGNSIDGNSLWQRRDLPDRSENDLFQGAGRPSSNLYSGTEMLGPSGVPGGTPVRGLDRIRSPARLFPCPRSSVVTRSPRPA